MKLPSIVGYKPMNSRVLVRIDQRFTDIVRLKAGEDVVDIKIDTSFEPEKHTITYGDVVALPDKLACSLHNWDMDWETDIEVEVGDRVYFSWEAVAVAFGKQGLVIESGGEIYVNIRYSQLTLKVSGAQQQDLVMLNGYCLVEEIPESSLPKSLTHKSLTHSDKILSLRDNRKMSTKYGRIIKTGTPNRSYENPLYSDWCEVHEGDLVCYASFSNVSVQYEMHADLIGKKNLFKIQRRFLLAVIN